MARHMITVTIACLLVSIATAQLCPEEEPFSVAEAFKRADNVLLGTDVTDLAGCQATDGGCSRRQIKFQVTCVLKQTQDLNAFNFEQAVNIGVNRTVRACDRTFFGYGPSLRMIVMVTRRIDSGRLYLDWQETNNATRAHYIYGNSLKMSLGLTCDLKSPFDASRDSCSPDRDDCCSSRCEMDLGMENHNMRVWLSSDEDSSVGIHCCKKLRAGATEKWISNNSTIQNDVRAQVFNEDSLPVVEISNSLKIGSDHKLAVAMFINTTSFQVAWLAVNIDATMRPDGFMRLSNESGITLVDYTMIVPKDEVTVQFAVFKHTSLPSSSEKPDVSKYIQRCMETDDSYIPLCTFSMDDFISDFNLKQVGLVKTLVAPDDWSVWTAIKHYDATPLSACPLINANLVPYGDTVLCPAAPIGDSLGVASVPSCLLLMSALVAILFLVK